MTLSPPPSSRGWPSEYRNSCGSTKPISRPEPLCSILQYQSALFVLDADLGARSRLVNNEAVRPSTNALQVFISYCHADEAWKDRVVSQLRVLEQEKLLSVWDDHRIS